MNQFPNIRLRRLRQNPAIRTMLSAPAPRPSQFIWPVFVIEGAAQKIAIESMPKQFRMSIDVLIDELSPVVRSGIGGVMLFGVLGDQLKTPDGCNVYQPDGLVQRAVKAVRAAYPDLLVFTDVCICAYTTHGHCAPLLSDGEIDNDASIEILAKAAVSHARAGAHGVAPSAMMDGQIRAIRVALAEAGLNDTILMSYSTKFASSMYGPFRDAADSSPHAGDRQSYQASYSDLNTALRESELDEAEGADMLMVKPAMCYLDVIAKIRYQSKLPLAAYNVSGEYSMLFATAERGWGDLYGMARENLMALSRAGTDIFLSYWANQYDEIF
jgi:porphobilinogen synthase